MTRCTCLKCSAKVDVPAWLTLSTLPCPKCGKTGLSAVGRIPQRAVIVQMNNPWLSPGEIIAEYPDGLALPSTELDKLTKERPGQIVALEYQGPYWESAGWTRYIFSGLMNLNGAQGVPQSTVECEQKSTVEPARAKLKRRSVRRQAIEPERNIADTSRKEDDLF